MFDHTFYSAQILIHTLIQPSESNKMFRFKYAQAVDSFDIKEMR